MMVLVMAAPHSTHHQGLSRLYYINARKLKLLKGHLLPNILKVMLFISDDQ